MLIILSNPILDAYRGSDFFGKSIFILLFLLSCTTWTLFLSKFFSWLRAKKKDLFFQENFRKKQNAPLALEVIEPSHPFSHLYFTLKKQAAELFNKNASVLQEQGAVFLSKADIELIEANLQNIISLETKKMEKNLFILSTIVSLAPFLGLLGTVWGILLTFAELKGGNAGANETILSGLAMALGTTVIGLVVAIPALVGYNYLRAVLIRFTSDMEDFSQLMLARIELFYRKIE